MINRLAARVINQEELAQQRGQALQVQEAINRLVIADTGDGILVVGRDSAVQISNPAAERMLGVRYPVRMRRFPHVSRTVVGADTDRRCFFRVDSKIGGAETVRSLDLRRDQARRRAEFGWAQLRSGAGAAN